MVNTAYATKQRNIGTHSSEDTEMKILIIKGDITGNTYTRPILQIHNQAHSRQIVSKKPK